MWNFWKGLVSGQEIVVGGLDFLYHLAQLFFPVVFHCELKHYWYVILTCNHRMTPLMHSKYCIVTSIMPTGAWCAKPRSALVIVCTLWMLASFISALHEWWNTSTDRRWERCLSVCLSVKRVDCGKMEERSVQIFIPYERSFSLVFWEEWLVRRWPLLPEILGYWLLLEQNRRF